MQKSFKFHSMNPRQAIPQQVIQRAAELREILERHNNLYYAVGKPEISDLEYDRLYRELCDLEKSFPELDDPASPTNRVGGAPVQGFAPIIHGRPMLSLDNTYSPPELAAFDNRTKKLAAAPLTYVVEPKIDGLAVSLRYENGALTIGATRGDGRRGDNITANIRTIRSVPGRLLGTQHPPRVFETRGEVFMPRADFATLNRRRQEAGEEPFANPRNAAAGSLKLLDPRQVAQRPLDIVLYAVGELDGISFSTHVEMLETLRCFGFKIPPRFWQCADLAAVEQAMNELRDLRPSFPFDIDGGVVKVNEIALHAKLGATAKNPRWAIAFKFQPDQAETRLRGITVQIGRTGALTPVAELEPVLLAGSTISRATLHNQEEITRKDIRIGDVVIVRKAGDVIPELVEPIVNRRTGLEIRFQMPERCPACGGPVASVPGETILRCENLHCPPQRKRWILHFAARGAMNIKGLGESLVNQLVDAAIVNDPSDLYSLQEKHIMQLERMAEKSAKNLLKAIESSKNMDLWRLIFGLGIRHVGSKTAQTLESEFSDMAEIASAPASRLNNIPELGPVIVAEITEFFRAPENQAMLEHLNKHGVNMRRLIDPKTGPMPMANKSFVLTGALSGMTREEAAQRIRAFGGKITDTVSAKTSFLVAGAAPGAKLKHAQALGVTVLDEAAFFELLNAKSSIPGGSL